MLKRLIYAFGFFIAVNLYAQDKQIDTLNSGSFLNYDDEATKSSKDYQVFGGGYTGSFLFFNFDAINSQYAKLGMPELSAPMYLSGGEGFLPTLFVCNNGRISIFGMGGTKSVSSTVTEGGLSYSKKLEFTVTGTGINLAYGIPVVKSFTILPALNLSWGKMIIEYSKTPENANWNDTSIAGAVYNKYETNYYGIQPNVSFEYAPANNLMLRLNAGYYFSATGNWEYNNHASVQNMPSKIKMEGMNLQFGVFVGIFNE